MSGLLQRAFFTGRRLTMERRKTMVKKIIPNFFIINHLTEGKFPRKFKLKPNITISASKVKFFLEKW